jgi:hypothetical protein
VTFAVDDADAVAAKAAELGGKVIVPPFDAAWSTSTYTIRVAVLGDPQGAMFSASKFVPRTRISAARQTFPSGPDRGRSAKADQPRMGEAGEPASRASSLSV